MLGPAIRRHSHLEERERHLDIRERDLLRDVNHRTRNNLQSILSIVNLQLKYAASDECRTALRQVESRIEVLAVLTEMLYRAEAPLRAPLVGYLSQLLPRLIRSHGQELSRFRWRVSGQRALQLPPQDTIACGLVVNELLARAITQAGPAGGPKRFEIEVTSVPAGIDLAFCCQFPDGEFDPKVGDALSTKLVSSLLGQLRGSLETDEEVAGEMHIVLPAPKHGEER